MSPPMNTRSALKMDKQKTKILENAVSAMA
jgi:hypothetical protein